MKNPIVDYAENLRKFSKTQYEFARKMGDAYDEQYYLGRMHSAKMIRDFGKGRGLVDGKGRLQPKINKRVKESKREP